MSLNVICSPTANWCVSMATTLIRKNEMKRCYVSRWLVFLCVYIVVQLRSTTSSYTCFTSKVYIKDQKVVTKEALSLIALHA